VRWGLRASLRYRRRHGGAGPVTGRAHGRALYVAHVSTRNSVAMVDHARRHGLAVTCEATPHHFSLADQDMAPYDSNYKMKPPLRSASHRAAVVEGLASGAISVIATDHAPHPGSEKMQEFERCPFGIIGLETALALGRRTGASWQDHPQRMWSCSPPAQRRITAGPGTLAPGAPGDVTVFSTDWAGPTT